MGSPERVNLFTLEGDLLRIDLDLEAHLGSTLQPGGWVILEKGNRISPEKAGSHPGRRESRGRRWCVCCHVVSRRLLLSVRSSCTRLYT